MRERIYVPGEEERQEYEFKHVQSLSGPGGKSTDLRIALSKEDGALREANFWDLDKTLLKAEQFHFAAVEKIFPEQAKGEESKKNLHEIFFAGFALGNSFREWDRMWRIYREGQDHYKDAAVYEHDFMGDDNPNAKLVDEPGHPEKYHERANEILQRYGKFAYGFMKEEYKKDPRVFREKNIRRQAVNLLKEKTRLGHVNVYMTANQKDFARGLVEFCGLSEYGVAFMTDEDMVGGGKEIAIKKAMEKLEEMGLLVNKNRATVFGDSIKGDVGSGAKMGLRRGVLIAETGQEIVGIVERMKKEGKDAEQLRKVFRGTEVEVFIEKIE